MFSWVGFDQDGVPYASPPRIAGRSKYTFGRMTRLATDAIVSFSDRPLRLALNSGFLVVSSASILFGFSALVSSCAGLEVVAGWTSVMILVGFVGGRAAHRARDHRRVRGPESPTRSSDVRCTSCEPPTASMALETGRSG